MWSEKISKEESQCKKIALIRLGALGDIIHGLPLISAIKKETQWHITWIAERKWEKVFSIVKGIDELILFDKPAKLFKKDEILYLRNFHKFLRDKKYDVTVDLQGLFKSALISYAAKAPCSVGFSPLNRKEPLSAIFSNLRVDTKAKHIVDRNLSLLEPLGIKTQIQEFPIEIPHTAKKTINDFFVRLGVNKDLVVGINLSAGWKTKQWPLYRFSKTADLLVKKFGAKVVIIWGPGEESMAEEVAQLMTEKSFPVSTDIPELAALLLRCSFLISSDTGPLHLAAALKTPTVALFGPTDPERNGPYGEIHKTIVHSRPCRNCYKRECKENSCMEDLSVEEVLTACEDLMGEI